jgi:hypothetical protein
VKKTYVKRLRKERYANKRWCGGNDAGLDYGAQVYSYGQVCSEDVINNYHEWYSFYDDAELAILSYQKALVDSTIITSIDSDPKTTEITFDEAEIKALFKKKNSKKKLKSASNVNW